MCDDVTIHELRISADAWAELGMLAFALVDINTRLSLCVYAVGFDSSIIWKFSVQSLLACLGL